MAQRCHASRYHVHGPYNCVTLEMDGVFTRTERQLVSAVPRPRKRAVINASLVIVGSSFYCVVFISLQHEPAPVLIRRLRFSDLNRQKIKD